MKSKIYTAMKYRNEITTSLKSNNKNTIYSMNLTIKGKLTKGRK